MTLAKTVQLPPDLYEAVRKEAASQQKTADGLVAEWVAERVGEQTVPEPETSMETAFAQEVAAFEHLQPTLQKEFAEQYVAIYQGEVVAHGSEKLAVLQAVRTQLGQVVCYIEKVSAAAPRIVRMPSIYIARS